jgi:hypothetical protein
MLANPSMACQRRPFRHTRKIDPLPLKAVILNDTRGDNHFGCMRVMRIIEQNRGPRIEIAATSLVQRLKRRGFPNAMRAADPSSSMARARCTTAASRV